jgi:class 3 adenylate cyclase
VSGIVTKMGVEGRRMMRLRQELPAGQFEALIAAYQRVVSEVLEQSGGRDVDLAGDSASASFESPREAVLAAAAVHRALAEQAWPHERTIEASIGLDSDEASACADLCDAAEGGQTFLSPATATLVTDEDLGHLSLRDLGEVRTRRAGELVRAYELVTS